MLLQSFYSSFLYFCVKISILRKRVIWTTLVWKKERCLEFVFKFSSASSAVIDLPLPFVSLGHGKWVNMKGASQFLVYL